jgi:hypothetical protein
MSNFHPVLKMANLLSIFAFELTGGTVMLLSLVVPILILVIIVALWRAFSKNRSSKK